LQSDHNPIARNYLQIIQSRLLEAATNETRLTPHVPAR
jgi:hypothetical protein